MTNVSRKTLYEDGKKLTLRSLFERTFCDLPLTEDFFRTTVTGGRKILVANCIEPSNLKKLLGSIQSDIVRIFLPKYDLGEFLKSNGTNVRLPKGRFTATKTVKLSHIDLHFIGQGVFTQFIADKCTLLDFDNCTVTLCNLQACNFAGSQTKNQLQKLYRWITRR